MTDDVGVRVLWNASVAIYDPYEDKMLDIIEFPGITRSATEHIGGVARDPYTGLISILVDSAAPWATGGEDVSGDNLIMKYDPDKKKILWTLNITAVTEGEYGGFQDVEHDSRGNTYIVGTFPGTIMKADKRGKSVTPWYLPQEIKPTTRRGYGGLAALGDILLTNDGDGQIYRFDMRQSRGKPVMVTTKPKVLYPDTDAVYLPPKYDGKVLLVASQGSGIQVLRSHDEWKTAEHLGTIPNPKEVTDAGFDTVASVQMGSDSVYIINDVLDDPWVEGETAGNRTLFPMPDITAQIEKLLKK
ncbi:hypothetical protein jhhlp_002907 [Lomentospora prolificans]|uniref:SMP-30/Gluconolactonase/LRE-like region domain-containing protein n=1 Tax=Lomentospora prolificans TaxID=41688 RepID=A0A2N3NF86_9PEZI|nr:hypothetical protein jhhlp_002907 [Lomentospora prolificans]